MKFIYVAVVQNVLTTRRNADEQILAQIQARSQFLLSNQLKIFEHYNCKFDKQMFETDQILTERTSVRQQHIPHISALFPA